MRMECTRTSIIWIILFVYNQEGVSSQQGLYIKIRPLRKIEFLGLSVSPLKPVLQTMSEVECALQCVKVEVCHLFTFKYEDYTCHLLRSVSGAPNLNDTEIIYKVFWMRGKILGQLRKVSESYIKYFALLGGCILCDVLYLSELVSIMFIILRLAHKTLPFLVPWLLLPIFHTLLLVYIMLMIP